MTVGIGQIPSSILTVIPKKLSSLLFIYTTLLTSLHHSPHAMLAAWILGLKCRASAEESTNTLLYREILV